MDKIAIIAPSEDIAHQFGHYIQEIGRDIPVRAGVLDGALDIAKELLEAGTEVIISRSGNSEFLREHLDIPVISCELALGDFIECLVLERKMGRRQERVALFWFEGYLERFKEIEVLARALDIDIKQYAFKDFAGAEKAVRQAIQDGAQFGFGGVVTGHYAHLYGMEYSIIHTTKENLVKAIDTAEQVLSIQAEERKKAEEYKRITEIYNVFMNFSHYGILGIDQDSQINIFNNIAEEILGIRADDALGRHILEIFPNSQLPQVIATGQLERNRLITLRDIEISVNRFPISGTNRVIGAIQTFQEVRRIQENEAEVRRKLHRKGLYAKYTFEDIIGSSPQIRRTIDIARKYASTDSTVLIRGETGTGKELFAQSIHNSSKRKLAPFVAVNCASLPENLLESELFGYEGGAFTGGRKEGKKGLFEIAHQGTIFLDEIGELPKSVQAKLLRVLQEKEIRRVGSDMIIPVDVRVIAATNRNLETEVSQSRFREDLYYRINILDLPLPSLSERPGDAEEISRHHLSAMHPDSYHRHRERWETVIHRIAESQLKGNIRQLINILERQATIIELDVSMEGFNRVPDQGVVPAGEPDEATQIRAVLERHRWNKQAAAEALGCSRTTLWRRMKTYGMTDDETK